MLSQRRCGVLLHPTSLPGPGGIGTLGEHAARFIDLLVGIGMSCWQVLPLNPPACGNSPYSAFSAFAGNPLLIDLHELVHDGDLPPSCLEEEGREERVDFGAVIPSRERLLRGAALHFLAGPRCSRKEEFWHFCNSAPWLHEYALFMALKQHYRGKPWYSWPLDVALLTPERYESFSVKLGQEIGVQKYLQWRFFRQWGRLREYAAERGIELIGDMPIFVALDSADVWRNRHLFLLDAKGKPTVVAGVPPDYFSEDGQLWGNPLYDWQRMEQDGYGWWVERFRHLYSLFDCVRIDHFRGFDAAWQVPAGAKTAVGGSWVPGPGARLFDVIREQVGNKPMIAEDLGVITDTVEGLRDRFGFPGMKILQFAFDSGPSNVYLPHNHVKNSVVYTGTHDNDTTRGWFEGLGPRQRIEVLSYLGIGEEEIVTGMIRAACISVAVLSIIPFQDVLGLPSSARMNLPGTAFGNWEWRFSWNQITKNTGKQIGEMVRRYGRHRFPDAET